MIGGLLNRGGFSYMILLPYLNAISLYHLAPCNTARSG